MTHLPSPFTRWRSVWHTPLAAVRTRTSPGPGASTSTASIASGSFTFLRTAAFISIAPSSGAAGPHDRLRGGHAGTHPDNPDDGEVEPLGQAGERSGRPCALAEVPHLVQEVVREHARQLGLGSALVAARLDPAEGSVEAHAGEVPAVAA